MLRINMLRKSFIYVAVDRCWVAAEMFVRAPFHLTVRPDGGTNAGCWTRKVSPRRWVKN